MCSKIIFMNDDVIVECQQIVKHYGKNPALDNIDLKLFANKITLLLGENGAGKTTLCRVLALLSKPHSGKIFFKGKEVKGSERIDYRKNLGYLSHQTFIYNQLSAAENLNFFADLYGIKQKKKKVEELLEDFGIYNERNKLAGTFSRGIQQRLALARVLLNDPDVILLDEPFSGLDQNSLKNLAQTLFNLKNNERTILIVTHLIDGTAGIADRCIILKNGRKVFEGDFLCKENLQKIYFEHLGGKTG